MAPGCCKRNSGWRHLQSRRRTSSTSTKMLLSFFIITGIVLTLSDLVDGHIALVFPPARKYDLDFLDNIRTAAPCGMPKGDKRTTLLSGSTINVTWHLSYPHRGGYKLELLNAQQKPWMDLTPITGKTAFIKSDTTAQNHLVRLQSDLECYGCTVRMLREASEWSGSYTFWSCADVDIVQASKYKEDCMGHGTYQNDVCNCVSPYSGSRCQYKDECSQDSECGANGVCVDIRGTNYPKKQCYCKPGWFGDNCALESPIKTTNFPLDGYNQKDFSEDFQMFWKILPKSKEIEIVLKAKSTSYLAVGWRPKDAKESCHAFPPIPDEGFTHEDLEASDAAAPEPEAEPKSTSKSADRGRSLPTTDENGDKAKATISIHETTPEPEPVSEPKPEPEPTKKPSTESTSINPGSRKVSPLEASETVAESESRPVSVSAQTEITTPATTTTLGTTTTATTTTTTMTTTTTTTPKPIPVSEDSVGEAHHGLEDVTYKLDEALGGSEKSYTHAAHTTTLAPPKSRGRRQAQKEANATYSIRVESSSSTSQKVNSAATTAAEHPPSAEPTPQPQKLPSTEAPPSSEPEPKPQTKQLAEATTHEPPAAEPEPTHEPSAKPEPTSAVKNVTTSTSPEPEPKPEPGASSEDSKKGRAFGVSSIKASSNGKEGTYIPQVDFHAMDCTDMIIGSAVKGNLLRVLDYYTRDRSTPRVDSFFGKQYTNSLTAAAASEEEGVTVIVFRRKLQANEPTDYSFEQDQMHVIWAKGQELGSYMHSPPSGLERGSYSVRDFYRPDELKYHGSKNQRGVASVDFFENFDVSAMSTDGGAESSLTSVTSGLEVAPRNDDSTNVNTGNRGGVAKNHGEWKTPHSCMIDDCEYRATWEFLPASDEILFTVSTNHTDQWTGIGFSADGKMPNTDAILGWVDISGRAFLMDTWITNYDAPMLDESQDLGNFEGSSVNGKLTLKFTRKRSTGDEKNDVLFSDTNCYYFVFPYNGGLYNAVSKKIRKHNSIPAVSNTKICIDSRAVSKNPVTPISTATMKSPKLTSPTTIVTAKTKIVPTTVSPGVSYMVSIRLPNQTLNEEIERGVDLKMLIRELLKDYMTGALKKVEGFQKVEVPDLESEKNESHVIAKMAVVMSDEATSPKNEAITRQRIKDALNSTIATGRIERLLVDPAYLVVSPPIVADTNADIKTGGAVARQEQLVIYLVIAAAAALVLLLIIQIICMCYRWSAAKKTRVSKERLITGGNNGWKDYGGGTSNYSYDAFVGMDDDHRHLHHQHHHNNSSVMGGGKHGKASSEHGAASQGPHHHNGKSSVLSSSYESRSLTRGGGSGGGGGGAGGGGKNSDRGQHAPSGHYSRRSESLPRPNAGAGGGGPSPGHRSSPYGQGYATHDPTGRSGSVTGLQPDFYFMPSQRRYSGEVVRVYVDYNNPNYGMK